MLIFRILVIENSNSLNTIFWTRATNNIYLESASGVSHAFVTSPMLLSCFAGYIFQIYRAIRMFLDICSDLLCIQYNLFRSFLHFVFCLTTGPQPLCKTSISQSGIQCFLLKFTVSLLFIQVIQ